MVVRVEERLLRVLWKSGPLGPRKRMPSIRALAPATRRLSTLALFLALLGAASMLYYHQALFIPRVLAIENAKGLANGYSFGNDFYQVWLTARQWMRPYSDLYGPEMTREIQIGLHGRSLDHSRPGDPVDPPRLSLSRLHRSFIFGPRQNSHFPSPASHSSACSRYSLSPVCQYGCECSTAASTGNGWL